VAERQRHLARLGADRWHAAGFRGKGVKVAILDTGFRSYRSHLGKALPARVTVRSFRSDGNLEARDSQHGILCGEVVHALAPDAELLFANWDLGREDEWLAAVRWARQQCARVITCSVITPSWSDGEGGGTVHAALARLLAEAGGAGDMLCFASAGNTTNRHWGGPFRDGGAGLHLWAPGVKDNGLSPWGDDDVAVELYARPGADYELTVHDADTGKVLYKTRTHSRPGDRSSTAIRFPPRVGESYSVRVRRLGGPAGTFHLTTTNASLARTTPGHNVCFPGDGPEVVALGAVDGQGRRWWWSACGPNSSKTKPDLVATIPFPSLWRPRPFSGTSGASPQAAALAALWWSRHPEWTAARVRAALERSARDLPPPGPDTETGHGLLHLPPP
jgi:hypothetical protein